MMLTTQLAILKADILASPDMSEFVSNGSYGVIRSAYNLAAVPNFWAWRSAVSIDEIMNNGFDWTRVDNATVGQARIWQLMTQLGVINPSKANVRAGIDQAWPGAQNQAMRDGIYAHCRELVTRAQRLFATGIGTPASPGDRTLFGEIFDADVEQALS